MLRGQLSLPGYNGYRGAQHCHFNPRCTIGTHPGVAQAHESRQSYLELGVCFRLREHFESTIRHLRDLLSASDLNEELVAAGKIDTAATIRKVFDTLKRRAESLASSLTPAFGTQTGIPVQAINVSQGFLAKSKQIASLVRW
jgi:hypothetical protein